MCEIINKICEDQPHWYFYEYVRVGSRITCNPAPTDTDQDWLIYSVSGALKNLEKILIDNGAIPDHLDEEYIGEGVFSSWRKGEDNFIVTSDYAFFTKFKLATELSKHFNLLDKRDRIILFQAILYNNNAIYE